MKVSFLEEFLIIISHRVLHISFHPVKISVALLTKGSYAS